MDHLPLPTESLALRNPKTLFLCNNLSYYDNGDFSTYPERAGVDVQDFLTAKIVDWDDLAPFLQAWLWFGSIKEVIDEILPHEHRHGKQLQDLFVDEEHEGRAYLNTRRLPGILSSAKVRSWRSLKRKVSPVLVKVRSVIDQVASTMSWTHYLETSCTSHPLPIGFTVLLSIQVLEATLRCFLEHTCKIPTEPSEVPTSEASFSLLHCLLQQAGWCPNRVRRLPRDIRALYYMSFMQPFGHQSHRQCTLEACRAIAPDQPLPRFDPLHSTTTCNCDVVIMYNEALKNFHDRGNFPVLSFREVDGGQRRLQIAQRSFSNHSTSAQEYVAISHVRHLGLGNLGSASLPSCQLASLQMLADTTMDSKRASFWIDTMCLPLDTESRRASLKHVSSIYKLATKVVVVDPSMCRYAVDSAQECLFRIRYSAWKERLWTLQEGVAGNQLYFEFKNKTVELRAILHDYEAGAMRLLSPVILSHKLDTVWLKEALEALALDIKSVVGQNLTDLEPRKLSKILRLGYLAFPVYRYLCEEDERRHLNVVIETLKSVYPACQLRTARIMFVKDCAMERLRDVALSTRSIFT
jgi:hypothetical protein